VLCVELSDGATSVLKRANLLGLLSHEYIQVYYIYIHTYIHRGFVSSITPTYFARSVCSDGASIPKYRRLVRIYEMEFVWWS
jgi:hypothetical protein